MTANNYQWNFGQYPNRGGLFPRDPRGPVWEREERNRFNAYRKAALLLNKRSASRPVLMSEVGVFGFFYHGEVIDSVGLCSPEALEFYPPPASDVRGVDGRYLSDTNNVIPTRMVLTLKPSYVVSSRRYIKNLLRAGSPFGRRYSWVGRSGRAWGHPVLIFRRRPKSRVKERPETGYLNREREEGA